MSEQSRPQQGQPRIEPKIETPAVERIAAEQPARKVTVVNSEPYPRAVDCGANEDGTRKILSIPKAKIDKLHHVTPGEAELTAADWELICAHPSAKHLVAKGTLSLKGQVR